MKHEILFTKQMENDLKAIHDIALTLLVLYNSSRATGQNRKSYHETAGNYY